MERKVLVGAVFAVSALAAGFFPVATAQTLARGIPVFEVDPNWPKVPEKWKLGDVSSIAIDAQD